MKSPYTISTLIIRAVALVFPVVAIISSECAADPLIAQAKAEVPASMVQEYGAFADQAVAALVKGDPSSFKSVLSPVTIRMEQRGAAAIDTIITERFIPFFDGYSQPNSGQQSFKTYRRIDDVSGVGFARSFTLTDGSTRFYVIFILNESGKLTVGNLLLDKKIADVN